MVSSVLGASPTVALSNIISFSTARTVFVVTGGRYDPNTESSRAVMASYVSPVQIAHHQDLIL